MPSFTRTESVHATPEAIFGILADVTRTPEWLDRCTQLDRLTDGPLAVGDALRYHYTQGRSSGVMDGTVSAYEPNRRLTNTFTDSMMDVTVDFVAEPIDATSTSLTHTITIETKGLMGRLLSPVISRQLPAQTTQAMAALKALAESGQ